MLFTFFLNNDGFIHRGTELIVQFGSVYHEPMLAQRTKEPLNAYNKHNSNYSSITFPIFYN